MSRVLRQITEVDSAAGSGAAKLFVHGAKVTLGDG